MTSSPLRLVPHSLGLVLLGGLLLGGCKRNEPQVTSDKPAASATAASTAASAGSTGSPSTGASSTASVAASASAAPDPSKIVADAARKDALKCFGDELKKDPKAGGAVTLEVGIAANGKVVKTRVVKTTSSKALTDCVVDAVGKLSMLEFKQATTLEVPFVFRD